MDELIDLSNLSLFVKIVEHGSIAATERALKIPRATLSRRLAEMERDLKVSLFQRSTRQLSLTDAGRTFFERARPIVLQAELATTEIKNAEPAGLIKISTTIGIGREYLAPMLFKFSRMYPKVRFELDLSEQQVNIIAGGFDLAVRSGKLEDSELVAKPLCKFKRVLIAAPEYLKRNKENLKEPKDLLYHECLIIGTSANHWELMKGKEHMPITVNWKFTIHDIYTLKAAVLTGIGIAILPKFLVEQELRAGHVVEILPGYSVPAIQTTALYPLLKVPSLRTRKLIDFLVKEFDGIS